MRMSVEYKTAREERKSLRIQADRELVRDLVGNARDILLGIISNPAPAYVCAILLLDYLTNHGKGYKDETTGKAHRYLTPVVGEIMTTTLSSAMVANALGGGTGVASVIKSLKGG
jgi:hypothetical protein